MATMSVMLILVIAACISVIIAFTLGQNRRDPVRVKRLVEYCVGLFVIAAVCLLPVSMLIWVVDSYLISIPMAMDAVLCYDVDPDKFVDNLENEEDENTPEKHREELRKRGVSDDAIHGIQKGLWTRWPIIVGATSLLLVAGIGALAHCNRAMLKELEANDSCPPGSAGSYVGARTLDSPCVCEPDVLPGEEWEVMSHSRQQRGNRSSHEIHQRKCLYERIAVASDDIARNILSSIAERGPAYAIERLAEELHEPEHHEIRESPSGAPEHDDEVYEERGYVLIWNTRRRYVSLAFAVEPGARGTS
jgi:hypothetical protein